MYLCCVCFNQSKLDFLLSLGMSVLHWAVDGEQAETVEYLINEGIQVIINNYY